MKYSVLIRVTDTRESRTVYHFAGTEYGPDNLTRRFEDAGRAVSLYAIDFDAGGRWSRLDFAWLVEVRPA